MNLQNRIPPAAGNREHLPVSSPGTFARGVADGFGVSVHRGDFGKNADIGLSVRRLCCAMLAVPPKGPTESALIGSPEMRVHETGLFSVAALVLTCCSFATVAADPSPEELLSEAISSWRAGDLPAARGQLSSIIESGSDDPRIFYYRGILDEQLRGNGDADFASAAKVEAETSAARVVNRALEKTQGPLRARIEKFRVNARNELKADKESAQRYATYREALDARVQGDSATALAKLNSIIVEGTDPRFFYMLGVVLAESGDREAAKAAFSDGLVHEKTPDDVQLVNLALANVQGDIRRMIEVETSVAVGDRTLSRQMNQREVQRLAAMSGGEVLAETKSSEAAVVSQRAAETEARRLQAAAEIAADNKLKEELAALALSAEEPVEPGTTRVPDAANPAAPADAQSEPVTTDAAVASSNPFLGGGALPPVGIRPAVGAAATSSISSGPIDMSYLPPQTEYLMYMRPADMLGSGFVKPLTEMPQFQQVLDQMSAQIGFVPVDIDSVTVGMSNLMATLIPVILQASSGGAPPDPAKMSQQLMGGENMVIVVRANRDVDAAAMIQAAKGVESSHEGKTYHVLQNPDPNAPIMAVHSVDARTYLIASEPGIKAVMTRGAGEPTREEFGFVSRSSHYVQVFSSPLLAAMSGSIPTPPEESPPPVIALVEAIKGKIEGISIVMECGSDLGLKIGLKLNEPSAADDANKALGEGLVLVKQMYPLMLQNSVPMELQPSVGQIVNGLSASAAESVVTVSLSVPSQLVKVLMENPQLLTPAMGAGGGPGGPGFGAPGAPPGARGFPGQPGAGAPGAPGSPPPE